VSPHDERVLAVADDLYALGLPEFTPARDAWVREHRADKEFASAIKRLRKPTLAAWVINLLVRRDPDQVEQVLAVGRALREAQDSLAADQLRDLTRQRRQLTVAVTTEARRLARHEGVRVTEAVADQVEGTLTAAMLDGEAARAVRSGLLVTPIVATGLGGLDLTEAVAAPAAMGFVATPRTVAEPDPAQPPQLRVVPDPDADARARAAADALIAEIDDELAIAAAGHRDATDEVEVLQARTLQLKAELDEVRGRAAEIESALEDTDDELTEAEALREAAAETVAGIEERLVQARRARAALR
jgi:hypothetical protein